MPRVHSPSPKWSPIKPKRTFSWNDPPSRILLLALPLPIPRFMNSRFLLIELLQLTLSPYTFLLLVQLSWLDGGEVKTDAIPCCPGNSWVSRPRLLKKWSTGSIGSGLQSKQLSTAVATLVVLTETFFSGYNWFWTCSLSTLLSPPSQPSSNEAKHIVFIHTYTRRCL